jgi:hypothetical protein
MFRVVIAYTIAHVNATRPYEIPQNYSKLRKAYIFVIEVFERMCCIL